MKVCHITSVHSYDDTRIYLKMCCSLARCGYEVHLVAPGEKRLDSGMVRLHLVKVNNTSRLSRMTKTVWSIYQKARSIDADIYHFHDPELIPAALLLKVSGKKVIYDVHEDVPRQILYKQWIPKKLRPVISWIIEKTENIFSRKFDFIITATPFIRKRFELIKCKAVDINNFPLISEFAEWNKDWNTKERAVCYIGGISDVRGMYEMVEAIESVDAKLMLVGHFWFRSQRQLLVKAAGWNNVVELGHLDRVGVKQVLGTSVAGLSLLHPLVNYMDAYPVKMFEYMAAGIPVIASDFPLWKEIIEGNQCGICINPLIINDISKAIKWILDHPYESKQMGTRGRKAIEESYNWELEEKKLFMVYNSLEGEIERKR